ncbi:TPA: restriction endonuclease subunit S [Klebsiella aerogenes]|uniref:restriction endonuclease subunit S n=1 Tax=Klebsiella aerogenes TaxID=548 RepID=UPI001BCFF550|nr:restriction endonuclease subunit S [Klebsiella aerogenes]HBR7310016.1 restriction endonuclease subunit S [Klebsiella aerogenes]HBR7310853.1 restriction endonuclease subunit S [Klebsiella aerogenes]
MGNKWATVSIDDIKLPEKYSCVGGPFGSSLSQKHYVDSGVPVIRGTNLAGDIFSESDFVFVSPDKANELQRNMAFRGDIVFTQRGTLGQVALIPEDSLYEKYIVSQSQMKLTVNPKQADAYFIYTYFRTNEAKALIENNAIIGGVPHINLGILKEFKLRLPPLSEQKRISEVSKSIDNKINLNRQINQTLEQISQTLFKSWFVDFDPVIDNALDAGNSIPEALQSRAELRQKVRNSTDFKPLPADIRALFPAEFEETELGWIPKNWHIRDFSDIAVLIKNNIKSDDICDDIHYIGLEHLERKHIFITSYGNGSDVSSNKSAFNKGDLLFGKLRPYFHKVAITPFSGICSTDILVFRAKEKFYKSLMAMYAFTDEFVAYANLRSTGTRMPRAEAKDLLKYKIILPNKNILEKFELLLEDYWAKGQLNNNENEQLTALRDTLLPKLISGELSLEDLPDLVTQTEPA